MHVGEVNIFAGPNFVLSIRNRSLHSLLGVRAARRARARAAAPRRGFVLYALMDAVVDRYFPIIDALETGLEAIEAQIFAQGPHAPTSSSSTR